MKGFEGFSCHYTGYIFFSSSWLYTHFKNKILEKSNKEVRHSEERLSPHEDEATSTVGGGVCEEMGRWLEMDFVWVLMFLPLFVSWVGGVCGCFAGQLPSCTAALPQRMLAMAVVMSSRPCSAPMFLSFIFWSGSKERQSLASWIWHRLLLPSQKLCHIYLTGIFSFHPCLMLIFALLFCHRCTSW